MAVTINGNGTITGSDVVTNSGLSTAVSNAMGLYVGDTFGRKNILVNAEFKINQRAVSSITANNTYGVDQWQIQNPAGWFTLAWQATDGTETTPTSRRMSMTFSATTKTSLTATEFFAVSQPVEGYNIADLKWGTAYAKPVTFSIDLKLPAGTVALSIRNGDATRSYVAPIVISGGEANTWVRKSVTIPGCPDGTWQDTTSVGMQVWLTFGCGTTYTAASASTWSTGNFISAPGATNYAAAGSVVVNMNAPQLERGSTASSFERVFVHTELLQCMRYYQTVNGVSTAARLQYNRIPLMTPMRVAPSITLLSGSLQGADAGSADAYGFYCPNTVLASGTSGWTLACTATL